MAPPPSSPTSHLAKPPTAQAPTGRPLLFAAASSASPPSVCVVAEVGVNHDGDADCARRLIDAAAQAGADAVKFQYFHPDRLLSNQAELAGYQQGKAPSQHALLRQLMLPLDTLAQLREAARAAGLGFVVTPFSPADAHELAGLELDAVKTASPDAVNTPLLQPVFALGVPVLISTGTCTLGELAPTAALLRSHAPGGVLLHCVSSYPTPPEEAGLHGMSALAQHFGLPVGYSDHTPSQVVGGWAAAAGAVVLEKHLTHDRSADGPDHATSLDADGFAAYIKQVRSAEQALGPIVKDIHPLEADVSRVSRQSVCVVRDLPAGHTLSASDITVKRPGTGLPAAALGPLVGRRLARPVVGNDLLRAEDLV